jgi:hypothetical protein
MDFYFNELSLKNIQPINIYIFKNLAEVIKKISSLGIDVVLNYHQRTEIFLQNQTLLQFIYSIPEKQGGLKSFLAAKFSQKPINTVYPEYQFQSSECYGLGLAFLNDSFSISLHSDVIWEPIQLEIHEITLDKSTIQVSVNVVNVNNITKIDSVEYFTLSLVEKEKSLNDRKKLNIFSGRELIQKQHLFEKLIFCNEIHDYLYNHFTSNTAEFIDLINKLISLNTYFQNELLMPDEIKSKVLGRPRQEFEYRRRLIDEKIKIEFSDNIQRNFYWHIDTYNSNGRMHFSPDFQNKKCYIGYIGPKIT